MIFFVCATLKTPNKIHNFAFSKNFLGVIKDFIWKDLARKYESRRESDLTVSFWVKLLPFFKKARHLPQNLESLFFQSFYLNLKEKKLLFIKRKLSWRKEKKRKTEKRVLNPLLSDKTQKWLITKLLIRTCDLLVTIRPWI